jgi:uncharacterized protein (TIGR02284 family)
MRDTVEVLKTLAEISRDGEAGFKAAAEAVKDARIRSTLTAAATRCATGAAELESQITKLGGTATGSGSVAGSLHRAWTDIKAAITGGDDKAILAECERGEDAAKAAYEKALQTDLPVDVGTIVRRQYQGVRQNHDLIRDMRDAA